jgi:hypothetical protein
MRSILTLTLAGLVAATSLATASAQTTQVKHRHRAPVQNEENYGQGWQQSPVAARSQPHGCVTDEGYGRTTPCDVGGGN